VGPFEEEEEGTSITSDLVKVKGAKSGHPRSPDLRNDTGTAISPISGQQNKATHLGASFGKVSWVLHRVFLGSFIGRDSSGAHPPFGPVIKLGIRHSSKKIFEPYVVNCTTLRY